MTKVVVKFNEETDSKEKRERLERETVGQHSNIEWRAARRIRLTVSNFGMIVKRNDTTSCKNHVKQILYPTLLKSAAIKFGRVDEEKVKKMYGELHKINVENCGMFVNTSSPFLGASNNGKIGTDGLIEVKSMPSVEEPLKEVVNKKNWFLFRTSRK